MRLRPAADVGSRYPAPVVVHGATLGPLLAAGHPAAIACQADTPGHALTHWRSDGTAGCVQRLDVHPMTGDPASASIVAGVAVYAGPLLDHFGHMLAEFIHRLWAVTAFPALGDATVVFQIHPGQARPAWLDPVTAMCGIDPARVLLVDRPTRFETLHVPEQGRVLGGEVLIPDYPALFPLVPLDAPPEGASRRLYVSRSRHIHSGSFLGESLGERVLATAGYEIVHPQEWPIRALVARLAAADSLIFSEGSAIHLLELCGPVTAPILLIGRRGATDLRFGRLLRSLTPALTVFPGRRATVCLDWERGGDTPRRGRGCSFVDLAGLIAALAAFTGMTLPVPDADERRAAIGSDLLRFLLDPMAGVSSTDQQLGRALRAIRDDPEIAALIAP